MASFKVFKPREKYSKIIDTPSIQKENIPLFYTSSDYQPQIIFYSTTTGNVPIYTIPAGYDLYINSLSTSCKAGDTNGAYYLAIGATSNYLLYNYINSTIVKDYFQGFFTPLKINSGEVLYLGVSTGTGGLVAVSISGFLLKKD